VPTQSDGSFPQAIENHIPLELARPLEWPVSFMRSSGVTPALASAWQAGRIFYTAFLYYSPKIEIKCDKVGNFRYAKSAVSTGL